MTPVTPRPPSPYDLYSVPKSKYPMRCYAVTFSQVVIRFYLMMACILIAGFSGWYGLAILALPLFLSAILGVSFQRDDSRPTAVNELRPRRSNAPARKAA